MSKFLEPKERLKVLELFSGIGGWARAFQRVERGSCAHMFDVEKAVDINSCANYVYELNFGLKPSTRNIETFTEDDLAGYDILVMSPPCQPFTRNNTSATRDELDPRSNALVHLSHLLRDMAVDALPKFIALENVVGFEGSACCALVLHVLAQRGFECAHFHLCPTQLGVPMGRPRYYLVCRLRRCTHARETLQEGSSTVESGPEHSSDKRGWVQGLTATSPVLTSIPGVKRARDEKDGSTSLAHYLDRPEHHDTAHIGKLYLSPETIMKGAAWCLDIVTPSDTSTGCFTKSYSRFFRGTGSVLLEKLASKGAEKKKETEECEIPSACETTLRTNPDTRKYNVDWRLRLGLVVDPSSPSLFSSLPENRLRFFSPRELLRLFGFNPAPSSSYDVGQEDESEEESFSFGSHDVTSLRKRYELLGNSVSVTAIQAVVEFMLKS